MDENRPITEDEFIALIAKRGTIPAVYTEQYDNLLKTKVSVSVKGKTNEGVDATGRGEALAEHAVATLIHKGVGSRRNAHGTRPGRRRQAT